MARLPVFHSNANISATNPVAPPPQSNVWEQAGKLAKIGQELAVKWQETQNAAETLDGKYTAESAMSDILQEANDYSGYESPKDIENKQNELLARNDAVLDDVTKGFTNDVNATKFRRQYMFESMRNREQIKAAFSNSFVETGDPAYKASYQADLDNSFKAGFIDAEQRANMSAKMNDWDFSRASRNVVANPEETLSNIKEYNSDFQKTHSFTHITLSWVSGKVCLGVDVGVDCKVAGLERTRKLNKTLISHSWQVQPCC